MVDTLAPASDAAGEIQKTNETEQKDTRLDLSGLEATVATFSQPKANEKKIDFAVTAWQTLKDKATEKAFFEKTFADKITKNISFTVLFVLIAFFAYVFQQYLFYVQSKGVDAFLEYYMPSIHQAVLTVSAFVGQDPDAYPVDSLINAKAQQNLNTIITDRSLNYITKKEVLTKAVDQLTKSTLTQYTKLDEVKQDIGSYGFFPKNVQLFAQSTFVDNSLQSSLLAVEAIRFSTALTFFSNLDTFLQQFGSYVSMSTSQIGAVLSDYKNRGEKDIQNYLTTCYFNPYVNADTCSMPQWNDFLNYYNYVDDKAFIDKKTFPLLMSYLDAKLENTDFPSLAINIKSFDPLQNSISFSIELNTFQADELQLLNKGILNPHIYLATKIINLLRESKFVVASPINLSTLKVNKKKLRIGNQDYVVNNSSFDFVLPLQKNAEREIYDYDQKQQ